MKTCIKSNNLVSRTTSVMLLLLLVGDGQGSHDLCSPRNIQKAMTNVCALHRRSVRLANAPPPQPPILSDYTDYDYSDAATGPLDHSNYGIRRTKRSVNSGEFRKHRKGLLSAGGFRRTKRSSVLCPPFGSPCVDVKYREVTRTGEQQQLVDLISAQEFEMSLRRQRSGSRDLRDNTWMVKYLEDAVFEDVQLGHGSSYHTTETGNPWLLQPYHQGDVVKNRIRKNSSYISKYTTDNVVLEQQQQPRYYHPSTTTVVDHTRQPMYSLGSAGQHVPPARNVWPSSAVGPPPQAVNTVVSRSAREAASRNFLRQPLLQQEPPHPAAGMLGVLRVHRRDYDDGGHGHRTLRDVWMQCCLEGCTLEDWVGGCM